MSAAIDEVGAVIVTDLFDRALIDRLNDDLEPWLALTPPGSRSGDPEWERFHGRNTIRVNGIAAKTAAFVDVCLDDTILGVADHRLIPDGGATQINDTQLIAIGPGEPAQYLHRDQTAWPWFNRTLPDGPEITVIAMVALCDITVDNGATRVVPGSHRQRDRDSLFDPAASVPAEMSAGSVLLFSGKTVHGGGANHTSDQWRRALHVSYLVGWLRSEEAHALSVPTDVAAALPRRAQELLGFAEYNPAPHGGGRLWLVDFEDPALLFETTARTEGPHANRDSLVQLGDRTFISEAGLETDLVFRHGVDLPHFAAFPLLDDPERRGLIRDTFQGVVDIARRDDTGAVLETPTWRANADWGIRLGYDTAALDRVNRDAVELLLGLRIANPDVPVVISGNLGPRRDGYVVGEELDADDAAAYHHPQVRSLAEAGVDQVSALTLTHTNEAIGIVRAATDVGVPVVISFTLETDGRLPSGEDLASAIRRVDDATDGSAAYFMVNCAHPDHFVHVFEAPGPWDRIRGIRANASTMSHAELDVAETLDRGDVGTLVSGYLRIADRIGRLAVVGGCCGTDLEHVDHLSAAFATARSRSTIAAGCP